MMKRRQVQKRSVEKYMSPMPIKLVGDPGDPDLFAAKYSMDCVPGPQPTAGAYTKGLTPGGFCGVQKMVVDAANYQLAPGELGGTLI